MTQDPPDEEQGRPPGPAVGAGPHGPDTKPAQARGEHRTEARIEHAAETLVETVEGAVDRVLPPHLRLRAWARRRRSTHLLWRGSVLIVGLALVIAGIVMLVIPGPGWASIILGLVVLASEYAWAHRLLEPVRRWARAAAAHALDPRTRRRNLVLLGLAIAVVVALAAWYVAAYGLTLDGLDALWPW